MKHSSMPRLIILTLVAVLTGGLDATSPSAAFAAGDVSSSANTTLYGPNASVGPSFALEIDGVLIRPIQEVSGLPGLPTGGEVTLTRRLTDDTSFRAWMEHSRRDPNGARKSGAINRYNSDGALIKSYVFTGGLPKSLENGTIMIGNTSVPAEKLVLAYKSMNPA